MLRMFRKQSFCSMSPFRVGPWTKEIADAIRIALTPEEKTRLARGCPVNVEAQDLYLLGMHLFGSGQPTDGDRLFPEK